MKITERAASGDEHDPRRTKTHLDYSNSNSAILLPDLPRIVPPVCTNTLARTGRLLTNLEDGQSGSQRIDKSIVNRSMVRRMKRSWLVSRDRFHDLPRGVQMRAS